MDLVSEYVEYHVQSSEAKDIDPANDCLKYVCDSNRILTENLKETAATIATAQPAPPISGIPNFPKTNIHVNSALIGRLDKAITLGQTVLPSPVDRKTTRAASKSSGTIQAIIHRYSRAIGEIAGSKSR